MGDPLEKLRNFAKKRLTKPKKPAQKNLGPKPGSNPCPSAWQTSKIAQITAMPSASRSIVVVSGSASQLIRLIESVTSLVSKKKCHCSSLRFLRKAPTKKEEVLKRLQPISDVRTLSEL